MNKESMSELIRKEVQSCNIKAELHRNKEVEKINLNESAELDAKCAELHEYYSNKLRYISLAITLLK